MKSLKIMMAGLVLSTLMAGQAIAAGSCGEGKITAIKEGGWNQNHFLIKIDYSLGSSAVGGSWAGSLRTDTAGWIRYEDTIDPERMKGIKAIAYLAFAGNKNVRAWTNGTTCGLATELAIYEDGITPN